MWYMSTFRIYFLISLTKNVLYSLKVGAESQIIFVY